MGKNQVGRPATKTDNRAKLIKVARKLFVANDDDKVSISAIAAQENLDSGLIRYYFKSKFGLLSRLKDHGILDDNLKCALLSFFSMLIFPYLIPDLFKSVRDISIIPEFMAHLAEQNNQLLDHGMITRQATNKDDLNDQQ